MARKRGQNEGSIYKHKSGLWCAQVTLSGKHLSKYFQSQTDARVWIRTTLEQVGNGMTLASAQLTVAEYLNEWRLTMNDSVRPHTLYQYEQIIRQHIVPRLGSIKMKDLRPEHIQGLYNEKLKSAVSARSVIYIHQVLHKALRQAVKWGKIVNNPTDAVNRPKSRRKEMHVLDDKQARTLLMVVKGTRYEALFWMAISTGMRQGELLGLRWSDIELQSRQVHIQRQVQPASGGGYIFTGPKSAAGRRAIILGEGMMKVLRSHISILQAERQQAGDSWQDNDLVFPSSLGTPWGRRNVLKYYKRFLKQAGLPDIRFHDLRHTAATLMLQQNINPKVVQEVLGHADITLTLNTYSHVSASMQKEAAAKVDELLTPIEVTNELKILKEHRSAYAATAN